MTPHRPSTRGRLVLACALGLAASACSTLSPDAGTAPVAQAARDRLGHDLHLPRNDTDAQAIRQRVNDLLADTLTDDTAVQITLLHHRGLQASLHDLGVADADLVQASRLPNPGFSFARLKRGSEREIERSFTFGLGPLLALPWSREIESRRLQSTQLAVTQQMLALAAQTRMAWVRAVAAEQGLRYAQQVDRAARASADLATRMRQAGNFSALQQAREQVFQADATLALAKAKQVRIETREALLRLLSLDEEQADFNLPDRLPDLPATPVAQPDVVQAALTQRLDVQAARRETEATASRLGLSRVTRFVNVLEFGLQRNSSTEAPRQTGWEVGFEIPLFDWSGARVARAESQYLASVNRTAQLALEARSEVREAYQAYRSAYDVARQYRDEIVPAAKRVSDENLLRYNGMLIGVFDLLADARAQIATVQAAIDAQRDFLLAQARLDTALTGKPVH